MSTTARPPKPAAKRRSGAAAAARRKAAARRQALRRRLWLLGAVAVLGVVVAAVVSPMADKAVQEIKLPLRHEDIIRQQAADKDVPPPLIAAVIYQESRFRDGQVSAAGAQGLMQLMPDTARYIAQLSGGTAFVEGDLATAQVNISYGTYYLRYLLDKYRGSEALALAAYNAGQGRVDEWLAGAAQRGETFDPGSHIPFPETANYVESVLKLRKDYAAQYGDELGL